MASLVRKDSYLQSLGRKVCAQPSKDLKRKADFKESQSSDPKKKKKKKKPQRKDQKPLLTLPAQQKTDPALRSFSTVDLLRKRLHEKIEESRCQVSNKTLSAEEIEKRRQKRKQERERKKRKRKELKMKAIEETPEQETTSEEKPSDQLTEDMVQPPLVFNKVVAHDEPVNKVMKKKEKKQSVKGNITPMTGKNYKQLLSRLEARKSKLEELRVKDQDKAKDFENKIKWTNVLYKAEGLKIRDDEGMLKTALKRKEKRKEQRKKHWDKRIQNTADKMQQRQDKRNRNIKKKKMAKVEKKKNRARKKGRIMPEDLAKASVK
ncbi:surfeit locus protein 6 [Phyllobates terribilis]|uniref:surfeit locus protein 6 n=1 Tax=Phyllobates terribilis TaxID=111132 RepID=UPI003CCAB600